MGKLLLTTNMERPILPSMRLAANIIHESNDRFLKFEANEGFRVEVEHGTYILQGRRLVTFFEIRGIEKEGMIATETSTTVQYSTVQYITSTKEVLKVQSPQIGMPTTQPTVTHETLLPKSFPYGFSFLFKQRKMGSQNSKFC
jgi:hypothetical protein